ncbi:hypothetical protein MKW98_017718 [Papaver atlanticum]|uniref:E3 ubiquitin-protein ligase RNF123/RKP TPR repeat domain-containing protein n=1 Tax=Papaver atlanticum TaxID=357466 RepID=A0AAD4TBH9_9MAGN|nr:hypothetical protein MKW98_017718 [Papaver atlanticum]
MRQVDDALDLSHTQNIGRMIKSHFPHSQVCFIAFESNKAVVERLPKALISAFDKRSWIPFTNILLRLCKGSGFGLSRHGELSSVLFQGLLREACIHEVLLSAFLNRLFNTLSWSMTEFLVFVREMQENYQVIELQQRKCGIIFDLSCKVCLNYVLVRSLKHSYQHLI